MFYSNLIVVFFRLNARTSKRHIHIMCVVLCMYTLYNPLRTYTFCWINDKIESQNCSCCSLLTTNQWKHETMKIKSKRTTPTSDAQAFIFYTMIYIPYLKMCETEHLIHSRSILRKNIISPYNVLNHFMTEPFCGSGQCNNNYFQISFIVHQ